MKKQILLLAMMLLPMVAGADDAVEIDGIYYELVSKIKEAIVTKNPNEYTGSVIIPASVTYDGVEYYVTSIGESAFSECYSLTSVTISYGLTNIGKKAFKKCANLTSVTIPNSVVSIGNTAFSSCSSLTSITIPNSVTSIGNEAFMYCGGLTSITIGNGVTTIGGNAFYYCSGLTSVHISDLESWLKISFSGSNSNPLIQAHSLYINGIETTNLVIPNSVTNIGGYAFYGFIGLSSVEIPNSVVSIGNSSFNGCSGLTFVTIPNSVTNIGGAAFYGCSNLTSIIISNSVMSIGSQAFASCKDLMDVYCLAESVPNTYSNAFQDSFIEYATLHVPLSSIDAYRTKEPWKNFKEIIAIDGETPEVIKCATPTIAYIDGKLVFDSETEGAEFVYEIKNTNAKKGYTKEVTLAPQVTTITVYATKTGYDNSDVATATIGWRNGTPILEGFSSIKLDGTKTNGDVNGDGIVDVADISAIISLMAGK